MGIMHKNKSTILDIMCIENNEIIVYLKYKGNAIDCNNKNKKEKNYDLRKHLC